MNLDDVVLTKEERARLTREMSHWNKLANVLYVCEDEKYLYKLLKTELLGPNRYYIVNRIYSRFNKVRRTRELKELKTWASNYRALGKVKRTPNDTLQSAPRNLVGSVSSGTLQGTEEFPIES